MEIKELLPIIGVVVGWSLSGISTYFQGRDQSLKNLGRAISNLYFLNMEMIQVKMAIETHKNLSSDVKEWESYRQRAFKTYANNDPAFKAKLIESIEYISESYPIEGFELRELLNKYEFMKSKSLEAFVNDEKLYITMLTTYETGFLGYQFFLEKAIRRLAKRHSVIEWLKLELHLKRIKKSTDVNDLVFGSQLFGKKTKKKEESS